MNKLKIKKLFNDNDIHLDKCNSLIISDYNKYLKFYYTLYSINNTSSVKELTFSDEVILNNNELKKSNFILLDLRNPSEIINQLEFKKDTLLTKWLLDKIDKEIDIDQPLTLIENGLSHFNNEYVEFDMKSIEINKLLDILSTINFVNYRFDDVISLFKKIVSEYLSNHPEITMFVFVDEYIDADDIKLDNIYIFSNNLNYDNFILFENEIINLNVDSLVEVVYDEFPDIIDKENIRLLINSNINNIINDNNINLVEEDLVVISVIIKEKLGLDYNLNFDIEEINKKMYYHYLKMVK